jgi:carboxylesterase type B
MGQQAGGASVHYHLLSPLARGLFNRYAASILRNWITQSPLSTDKFMFFAAPARNFTLI